MTKFGFGLLASMDAVFIQYALLEDKLLAAPKKAKKIIFTDPFIYHAINAWLRPVEDPYHEQMIKVLEDNENCAQLVEACVVSHYRRYYPSYYIKADGEVDLAYIKNEKFWPIEVKWTTQIRPKDLKQLHKYPNARLLAKVNESRDLNHIKVEPLPLALLEL